MRLSIESDYFNNRNSISKGMPMRKNRSLNIKNRRKERLLKIANSIKSAKGESFDHDIDSFLTDLSSVLDITVEDVNNYNKHTQIPDVMVSDNSQNFILIPSVSDINRVDGGSLITLDCMPNNMDGSLTLFELNPLTVQCNNAENIKGDVVNNYTHLIENRDGEVRKSKWITFNKLEFFSNNTWFSIALFSLLVNIIIMFIVFFQKKQLSLLLEKLS